MNKLEKDRLKSLVDERVANYKHTVEDRYSSAKNGSIMIADDLNNSRNEIMRRIKLEQLKKRCLPYFIRQKREDILKDRVPLPCKITFCKL